MPPAQQLLARPWSELKDAQEIKHQALVPVAAFSMISLTAHLSFKLLNQQRPHHGYSVDMPSFLQRLNHARLPALALRPVVIPSCVTPFPKHAEQMLARLYCKLAARLNFSVALIPLPSSQQDFDKLFQSITATALPHARRMLLNPLKRKQAPEEFSHKYVGAKRPRSSP